MTPDLKQRSPGEWSAPPGCARLLPYLPGWSDQLAQVRSEVLDVLIDPQGAREVL